MGKKLLLCDSSISTRDQYDIIINFNYSNNENEYSIPKIIEDNADKFKAIYLDWVYELGHQKINGKIIIDLLSIRKDFSFWWTTLIFEKSKWKSPGIFKSFQLIALFSVLDDFDNISSVDVSLSDHNFIKSIKKWSIKKNVKINNINVKINQKNFFSLKVFFDSFPHFLRGIIWLVNYSIKRWPRSRFKKNFKFNSDKNNLLILSYFLNIDKYQVRSNTFRTGYWTQLHDLLPELKIKTNWLHLFVKSEEYKNPTKANDLLNRFNNNEISNDFHSLVDNYLSIGVIIGTLKDYLKIVFIGYSIKNIKNYFVIENTEINLWNFQSFDWKCSIFGKTSIANCLYLNLFEKVFKEIPTQNKGLYLLENQPWEKLMLYAWRKNNHGSIIGVQHTIVNFWDLRHFSNVDEYKVINHLKMPTPDKVALNGPVSQKLYEKNLKSKIIFDEVEALRYLHLDIPNINNNIPVKKDTLLVLGDFDPNITLKQMQLLSLAMKIIDFSINIIVKPHPMSPIKQKHFPDLDFKVVTDSIEDLRSDYSFAYCSNPTAASLDVYLSGKKVIVMLDSNSFNMSPLRGCKDVDFITTGKELSNKISDAKHNIFQTNNTFFYIDSKLPRWKKLLNSF